MKFYAHPDSKPQNRTLRGGRLTKWKGRAVSISPALGVISAALLMSPPVSAQTTCTEVALSSFVCTGPVVHGQATGFDDTRSNYTLGSSSTVLTEVVIDGGFGEGTNSLYGSNLRAVNGHGDELEITTQTGAIVYDLAGVNFGSGALTIDTTDGTVNNIDAYNSGTDLTIRTGVFSQFIPDAYSINYGFSTNFDRINADNRGTGALVIDTSAGSIRANRNIYVEARDSIVAENHGTDLTITTAGTDWITATQFGTGDVAIDTTGGYSNAIVVETVANSEVTTGREVTITTADVGGIYADVVGNDSITIDTTAGTVDALYVDRSYDYDETRADRPMHVSAEDGNIDIRVANVFSQEYAPSTISVAQSGTGRTTLSIEGFVSGGYYSGVTVDTAGTALVTVDTNGTVTGYGGGYIGEYGRARHAAIQDTSASETSSTTVVINGTVRGDVWLGAGQDNLVIGADASLFGTQYVTSYTSGEDLDILTLDGGDQHDVLTISGEHTWGHEFVQQGVRQINLLVNWEEIHFSDDATTHIAGTLDADQVFLGTGQVFDVANGLSLTGNVTANASRISAVDNTAGRSFAIDGNLTGTGVVALDVDLGSGVTDQLTVSGDVDGAFGVEVNALGMGEGVHSVDLITVNGTSAAGDFTLLGGPISFGGFAYDLAHATPGVWSLQSGAMDVSGVSYTALPMMLLYGTNAHSDLEGRLSGRGFDAGVSRNADGGTYTPRLTWATVTSGKHSDTAGSGTYTSRTGQISAGRELGRVATDNGVWVIDALVRASDISGSTQLSAQSSTLSGQSLSFGVGAAWLGANGTYVDLQAHLGRARFDMADSLGNAAQDVDSTLTQFSAEVGKRFSLNNNAQLTLRGNVMLHQTNTEAFTNGTTSVARARNDTTTAGIGAQYSWLGDYATFSISADVMHQFGGDTSVVAGGNSFVQSSGDTYMSVGLNANFNVTDSITGTVAAQYAHGIGGSNNARDLRLSVSLGTTW